MIKVMRPAVALTQVFCTNNPLIFENHIEVSVLSLNASWVTTLLLAIFMPLPINSAIKSNAYSRRKKKKRAIDTFFVKVREELDIIPAKVQILEYMQEKAVFKDEHGMSTIKLAEVIKHPVPKAMGSVNLMTYIVISKYLDGLPLYRLENIIKRYGGDISRATLANWMIALAKQAQPLINLLREHQHSGSLIMADDKFIGNEFKQRKLAA